MSEEFERKHLSSKNYLLLPQTELRAGKAAEFLAKQARNGYLLVSLAEDEVLHADAQFRQQRGLARPPMPAEAFRQRNIRFHNWLCDQNQPHLPIRMAPNPTAATALVWLIPAPETGKIIATGFSQEYPLDERLRESWLLTWARRIGEHPHATSRLVLQLPAAGPAYWFYRIYRGDLALEGSQLEQLRMLLSGLPLYPQSESEAIVLACQQTGTTWPMLVNQPPATTGQAEERSDTHGELMLMPNWYY